MIREAVKPQFWKGEFLRNYSILSLQPIFNFIGQLLLVPFYTSLLGIGNVGILFSIMVVTNSFLALLDFNLLFPLSRMYQSKNHSGALLGSYLVAKSGLILISGLGLLGWLLLFEKDTSLRMVYLLFFLTGVLNPFQFEWLFIGANRIKEMGLLKAALSVSSLLALYGMVYFRPEINTIPIVITFISALFFAVMLVKYRELFSMGWGVDFSAIRKMSLEALPLATMQIFAPFGIYYGVVAFQKFSPIPELAGPVGIGQKMALSLLLLAHPLVLTLVNKMIHSQSFESALAHFWKITLGTVILVSVIWAIAPLGLKFAFTEKMRGGSDNLAVIILVFKIYLVTVGLLYLRSPIASILLARGRTVFYCLLHVVPIGVCFGPIIYFAKQGNILGVILACAASEWITTLLFFILGIRLYSKKV